MTATLTSIFVIKYTKKLFIKIPLALLVLTLCFLGCKNSEMESKATKEIVTNNTIISIWEQGTFAVGGTVKESDGTFDTISHGAFNPSGLSTPDRREGYQSIFLRKKFPVYLMDQPRRGLAGQSLEPRTLKARTEDQLWFGIFRMGKGNEFYPNIKFSKDPEALNQFFYQSTPATDPLDININIRAVSELLIG